MENDFSNETSGDFETFDSFSDAEVSAEEDESVDDWSKPEPEAKKEKVSEDLKVLKDSEMDSEGDLIEEKEKITKKSVKKEEDEDFEELEEEEPLEDQNTEKLPEDKKDTKNIRLRMGDDLFNIDPNASVKVKVDGELSEVSVQELINNYSGKTAWDKKFTEIGKEKKALQVETQALSKQKESLLAHLNGALKPLKDPTKNPMESLLYLVEMSGEDPYTAYRRMMESNLDELSSLLDMDETQRELHFHKKKDELHQNVARKRQEKHNSEQAFNQAIQKVDSLRQAHNVSEDDFVDASEELESIYKESGLDLNGITDEAIVDYASLRTHISKVKELAAPYEENIAEKKYGDVVAQLSRALRDGTVDEATVKTILKRNFSVEEDVKELNTKVYQKQTKKPAKKIIEETSEEFESFDNF